MPYLADTHIVVWSWHETDRLSKAHKDILNSQEEVFVSVASIWEMAIKAGIGKLNTVDNIEDTLYKTGYSLLEINASHVEATRHLPLHHRDPFDRLLVVQAKVEGLTLLSADKNLKQYDVNVI